MQLRAIKAAPHPFGGRIDLAWTNPDPSAFPQTRLVRREGSHPRTPDDGVVVAEAAALPFTEDIHGARTYSVADEGLQGETVYYYTLFPYQGNVAGAPVDPRNRTAAMATASYDFAGWMYELLPAVYHRYDTALGVDAGGDLDGEDLQRGQLRRFMDLFGSHFDQVYSYARAALGRPAEAERLLRSLLADSQASAGDVLSTQEALGTLLLDHRYRRDKGAVYAPFELSTSNLPLLAIIQGRQNLGTAFQEIGLIRIVATVLIYGLLLHFHGWIFGVPAFPV